MQRPRTVINPPNITQGYALRLHIETRFRAATAQPIRANATIGGNNVVQLRYPIRLHSWHMWTPLQRKVVIRRFFTLARHNHQLNLQSRNNILWVSATITQMRRHQVVNGVRSLVRVPGRNYIHARYSPIARFNINDILRIIDEIMQSVHMFNVEDFTLQWTNLPSGSGKLPITFKHGAGKRSTIPIYTYSEEDHLCAQRALCMLEVYKKKHESKETKALWRLLRGPTLKLEDSKASRYLTHQARNLSAAAGIETTTPTDFADLTQLAQALSARNGGEAHIQVFSASNEMNLLYSTAPEGIVADNFDSILWFDLILDEDHYTPVMKIHRLLCNQRNFCYRCKKTYHKTHVCAARCSMCHHDTDHFKLFQLEKEGPEWRQCEHCWRKFYTQECFDNHKQTGLCDKLWKCLECNKTFTRRTQGDKVLQLSEKCLDPEEHNCGLQWCQNCVTWVTERHQCFMKVTKPKKPHEQFLFADFEATQDTGTHIVNLAVTQTQDGTSWPVFGTIEDWVEHLLHPEWQGYTVVFHNGKGYDFQFILNNVLKRRGFKYRISPVMVGAKILYFTLTKNRRFSNKSGIRFVDSVNFLPMALKRFTKTFSLQTKKGYYPHFFNTPENENYIGPLPPEATFGVSSMSTQDYKTFKEWYEERKLEPWDNAQEILNYCIADVQLLREGCMAFRSLVMSSTVTGHDPFANITLASSAMHLFRSEMLIPNTIAALTAKIAREIRPCLAGGRTGATKLYVKALESERLEYIDFTSAYPYVCKNGIYPLGHPIIWSDGDSAPKPSLHTGAGIWMVDITCPQDLYHPLLHFKDSNTMLLLFDLRPKVRAMYTSFELQKALELGYVITKVYKVYHWVETIRGVFKDYINIFLKMKQQAAGWPSENMSEEEKQEYIADYKLNEGIQLDPTQIEKNSGKYHVSKLYLNSLWGKFGQRLSDQFNETRIFHDTTEGGREFNKLCAEDRLKEALIINDHTVVATAAGKVMKENQCIGGTNMALAIFTTAHARLKLYNEILEPLGDRVCYYDTDSAIFKIKHTELAWARQVVPLGKYLGDITNELGNKYLYDNEYIVEFVSGGPKNYGYITNQEAKVAKIKGHSLKKRSNKHFLNFQAIKDTVLNQAEFSVNNNRIIREKGFILKNEQGDKVYRLAFLKRRILPTEYNILGTPTMIDTRPWDVEYGPLEKAPQPMVSLLTRKRQRTLLDPEFACVTLMENLTTQEQTISVMGDSEFGEALIVSKCVVHLEGFKNRAEAERYKSLLPPYYSKHPEQNICTLLYGLQSNRWLHLLIFAQGVQYRSEIYKWKHNNKVMFIQ